MTAKKMPGAKPQKKRQSLTKQCDALFGKIVRAPGQCVNCGSTEVIQCAHGFSRRYRAIRWDLRNAFCLCRKCHMFFTHHPIEWERWLRNVAWGDQLYEQMQNNALYGDRDDLSEVLARLEALWAEVDA